MLNLRFASSSNGTVDGQFIKGKYLFHQVVEVRGSWSHIHRLWDPRVPLTGTDQG
jgi:hypothetical protein